MNLIESTFQSSDKNSLDKKQNLFSSFRIDSICSLSIIYFFMRKKLYLYVQWAKLAISLSFRLNSTNLSKNMISHIMGS